MQQMGSVEDRNRARRKAGGAFFASPDSAASPASNTAAAEKKGFLNIPPLKIFTPSPTFDTKSGARPNRSPTPFPTPTRGHVHTVV